MSQENSKSEKPQDTRKKIALGGLLVLLAGVIYYQFFSGSDAPSSPRQGVVNATSNQGVGQGAGKGVGPTPRPAPRANGTPEPIISQPLDLAAMQSRDSSGSGTGRNIFIFPPPPTPTPIPPPSPTPTPTPLPIQVFSVNPGGVIARTGDFTLTV